MRLISYLKSYKADLSIVMIALLCVSLSLLGLGSVFRGLIDNGLNNHHTLEVNKSILLLVGLIIIFSVGSFFRSYFINNVTEKIINQIREEAYNKIINFQISSFEELKVGDIISRLTVDIELFSKLIINFLSFFIRNSIMLVGAVILMFYQSPKLTFLAIVIIPLLLFPLIQFGKYIKILSKKVLEMQADITANLEESVTNIVVIQAFNQQVNKISNFKKQTASYLQCTSSRLKIRSIFFAIAIAVILFSITLVIWIGSRDILSGNLTSGQMLSFIYYALVASLSSGGIFELLSEVHSSIAASERVFALIDYDSYHNVIPVKAGIQSNTYSHSRLDPESKKILKRVQDDGYKVLDSRCLSNDNSIVNNSSNFAIEFSNINFSYPSRPDLLIFKGLSFEIKKGQFIGIVGRSGAGKSTIMQLLLKFYFFEQGIIKIMGQDMANIIPKQIRQLIGYVPQDASIFSGTIKSNIAFVKPDASEEEIIRAATITGIIDFTKNLSEGLDTEIGEKGIRLSGGQKQRIAISRAILYNPEILLLDEAMSALDNENEQKLLRNLKRVMQGKTIISIAHRIASVQQADEIMVIDHGLLIARDSHSNLLKNCETYQILCKEEATTDTYN
ncbi:MAG: ATP-binding cassette domain-containing protein [Rickettsia endosymbiont of Bryobia graminum]|nr:ATP-binding cassette domain-containing protein [Rickettsia endosymbiont of Bryobia graminum]